MGGRASRLAAGVAMALTAVLSASLLVYLGVLWQTVRAVDEVHTLPVANLRTPAALPPTAARDHNPVFTGQNLLVVGNDDRSGMTDAEVRELKVGRDGGSLNTDSLLIVHVPADGSRATLISMPRDSYVHIPGFGMNRINAAYGMAYNATRGSLDAKRTAGMSLLIKVVTGVTGVPIDHFVQVSLLGFVRISDAIGNVPIDLCHSVDDTVAYNRSIGVQGGSGLKLSKGRHEIHGVQALEFVRQRHHLLNGDVDRAARQRYFLTATFRAVTSASMLLDISKLHRLIDAVRTSVYADPGLKVLDLAQQLSNLSANNITGHVIPTAYYWHTSPVGDVGIVRPADVRADVERWLSPGHHRHAHRTGPKKARHAVDSGCIN